MCNDIVLCVILYVGGVGVGAVLIVGGGVYDVVVVLRIIAVAVCWVFNCGFTIAVGVVIHVGCVICMLLLVVLMIVLYVVTVIWCDVVGVTAVVVTVVYVDYMCADDLVVAVDVHRFTGDVVSGIVVSMILVWRGGQYVMFLLVCMLVCEPLRLYTVLGLFMSIMSL